MSEKKYSIFVAQPNAGNIMPCCVVGLGTMSRRHTTRTQVSQFGNVSHNFNMLWCHCLNDRKANGYTHFAMLHADIDVSPWWLDTLIEEMDRVDADVMTTVVPIKDERGLTTTGIRYPGQHGVRRFTMREIMQFPETFSIEDVGDPADEILAINTGVWVCRVDTKWANKFPGFDDKYRIRIENGVRLPDFDSEDWRFSLWLAKNKVRTFATRKVRAAHAGCRFYPNDSPWGEWETEHQPPKKPVGKRIKALVSPGITIETEKPIAVDSKDHINPLGAAQDNTINRVFNRKLYELIPAKDVRLLDIGCAGGGLVRSILEDGGFAVGVEGSSFPRENRRGEWESIPDWLFNADATEPFQLRNGQPLRFNVVTGWEFLEHIPADKLPAVVANIRRHAAPDAIFVGSISQSPDFHHETVHPKAWWADTLGSLGLEEDTGIEEHFGNVLLRGHGHEQSRSFSFAAKIV